MLAEDKGIEGTIRGWRGRCRGAGSGGRNEGDGDVVGYAGMINDEITIKGCHTCCKALRQSSGYRATRVDLE